MVDDEEIHDNYDYDYEKRSNKNHLFIAAKINEFSLNLSFVFFLFYI